MPSQQKPGAVLFAKNMPRVAAFYEALLGLKVTHAGKDIIVLESPMQQLLIHAVPERIAKTIRIDSPPKRREDRAVKLVFPVLSLAETRVKAKALGGELNPPSKAFEARGFRACDGHDPEGNVIQFREDL